MPTVYVSDLANLGRFVRRQRRQLGLTQAQLGVRLDWYQERVSLLEAGKSGTPSLKVLATLAGALVVARADLLVAVRFLDNPVPGERGTGRPPAGHSASKSTDHALSRAAMPQEGADDGTTDRGESTRQKGL